MWKKGKRVAAAVMTAVFLSGFALPVHAEATLEDVLKRVEALEKENAVLKAEVQSMQATQAAQLANIQKTATAVVAAAPASAPSGNSLKTKFETELYGFIKADMIYASNEANSKSSVNNGTAIAYSSPWDTAKKRQATFNGSAQDTRIGLNVKVPKLDAGGQITGKIEFDFANSALTNSSSATYTPRLRLAYVDLGYDKWGVRAGQDWDFFAPVNTSLLNSANAWRAGNIGHRHPQAYLTNNWGAIPGGKLTTKVGVIDSDDWSQENSGEPVGGALVAYQTKLLGVDSVFNLGGIYGRSSTDYPSSLASSGTITPGSEGNKTNDIYAVVASTTLKFTDWLSFKAKGFQGQKLEKFMVNNAIGVNNLAYDNTTKALHSIGGFMELTFNPLKKVETNYGFGYDGLLDKSAVDNVGSDTNRANVWSSNETYWTNIKYSLTKDILVGLEYEHFDTKWLLNHVNSTDDRVESSFILKF